jgi:hypothetical protein
MAIYRGVGGTGDTTRGESVEGPNTTITQLTGIEGPIKTPTYIEFNQTANPTLLKGQLGWNSDDGTLDIGLNLGGVVLQVGEETLYRVVNMSGSTIDNGELVMANGTVGNSGKIKIIPWDGSAISQRIMGITTEDIPNGENGYVTHFGKVRGIQTNGGNYSESWVDGDILYAGPTGGLTKVKPTAPKTKSIVALVIRAHPSNGTLFVRPSLSSSLADDDLVQLTSLANNDVIAYNSTSGRFENVSAALVSGSLSDGDYGDITVSTGGTVWTIDNGAVDLTTKVTGTLPVANGGTGITSLGTGVATFLGTPTSANLKAAVTNETGSGALVFATSPTLVTPALGTPSSGTLTNATGLPIEAGTTGTLGVARGGTGTTTLTANNVLLGNGTSAPLTIAPSTSGNVLTSNGTTWSSAAPVSSVVTKEVTSTSDLSLTDWTSGTLPTSISNIGSSFSVVIPTSGVIKLNITLRLQNGAENYAQSYFGIRIGSTNYMFGYILDNVPDAIDYTGNLSTFSEDTNDYINYYGESNSISFFGLGTSLEIDIIGQSVPTGTQTVQLFAAGQGTAIIKGTALTTRALIQFIGVN